MEKQNSTLTNNKVKLLCSYGGKIQPRPSDHQLCYIGGDTKILAVERSVTFVEIVRKLNSLIRLDEKSSEISIKYQYPGEDLDSLVSIIDDDDVEHMMIEYDRMQRSSTKPTRLRMFIFDVAITTLPKVKKEVKESVSGNPDYLFGFDEEYKPSIGPPLDLLQIPGMVLPQNYELVPVKNNVTKGNNGNSDGMVYRIPVVANGGVYQTGQFAYGMVTGNREQPVYNFVPVQSAQLERKVNNQQHIF